MTLESEYLHGRRGADPLPPRPGSYTPADTKRYKELLSELNAFRKENLPRRSSFVPIADPHGYISGTKAALVIICFILAFLMGVGVGFIVGRLT